MSICESWCGHRRTNVRHLCPAITPPPVRRVPKPPSPPLPGAWPTERTYNKLLAGAQSGKRADSRVVKSSSHKSSFVDLLLTIRSFWMTTPQCQQPSRFTIQIRINYSALRESIGQIIIGRMISLVRRRWAFWRNKCVFSRSRRHRRRVCRVWYLFVWE